MFFCSFFNFALRTYLPLNYNCFIFFFQKYLVKTSEFYGDFFVTLTEEYFLFGVQVRSARHASDTLAGFASMV